MGQFTRLPYTSLNTGLQTLALYDTAPIKEQILALASLRAFFDFTDSSTMTLTGTSVDQINDQSGNGLHLTASTTDRPTWTPGALGWAGATLFSDNRMTNDTLFSGAAQGTVVMGFRGIALDGTSRMIVADASDNNVNFYMTSTEARAFAADVFVTGLTNLNDRNAQMIVGYDDASDPMDLTMYIDGQTATDTTTRNPPDGKGAVGGWTDALTGNRFEGYLTHLIILDQDVSADAAALALLQEYGRRKLRISAV